MHEPPVRKAVPAVLPPERRTPGPKPGHHKPGHHKPGYDHGAAPHPCARLSGGNTCCGGCRERLAERQAEPDV